MQEIVAREPPGRARGDAARRGRRALPRAWASTTRSRSSRASPTSRVSLYRQGDFVDLCRGPHVPSHRPPAAPSSSPASPARTGAATSATRCCSASTAPRSPTPKELDAAPGAARGGEAARPPQARQASSTSSASIPTRRRARSSTPRARSSTTRSIDYIRELVPRATATTRSSRRRSSTSSSGSAPGHYENYQENMYFTEVDERQIAVKPMNCPGHCLLYARRQALVPRAAAALADFGRLHRYERSGVTARASRACARSRRTTRTSSARPSRSRPRSRRVVDMICATSTTSSASTERRVYLVDAARRSRSATTRCGSAPSARSRDVARSGAASRSSVNAGDGAFYGPKIDFRVLDALRREWQLGTIQLDFSHAGALRPALTWTPTGSEERPVMIHRAMLGSIERFIGDPASSTRAGRLPALARAGAGAGGARSPSSQHDVRRARRRRAAGARASAPRPTCATRSSATRSARRSSQKIPVVARGRRREVAREHGRAARRGAGKQLEAIDGRERSSRRIAEREARPARQEVSHKRQRRRRSGSTTRSAPARCA